MLPHVGQSFSEDLPRALSIVPILMLSPPSESSFSDLPHRKRIGINGSSTRPHATPEVYASSFTRATVAADVIFDVTLPR